LTTAGATAKPSLVESFAQPVEMSTAEIAEVRGGRRETIFEPRISRMSTEQALF
jgi:hypothetical protein